MNPADLKFDRFEEVMHNWARFQKHGGVKLGYPARSTGLSTGGASQPSDELLEPIDFQDVLAADAAIEDLRKAHMAHYSAIQHAYLAAVYQFRKTFDFDKTLAEAKDMLRRRLTARGIWLGEV